MSPLPAKVGRLLHIILVAFLLIGFRIWHLGVVQREEKLKEATRPKQRAIWMRADRGAMFDRFHIPLAVNRICYNAAIYYNQIAQIPTSIWKMDETGQRIRVFARKEYVQELSRILAETLHLEAERIEDLIHSKASLLPHVPYILKSGLSEEEHYRLKMLERDWLGIHAEIQGERYYPRGKIGSHIIGRMGAISQKKYASIGQEIADLEEAIAREEYDSLEEAVRRLSELKEKAYGINDWVGKSGIEEQFEEALRGSWGLKTFEVDQKGIAVKELPGGKIPIPGRSITLSISAELQEFAEALLAKSEKERKRKGDPWIKGGAIVALDPKTGEILALASHPNFDPNDFISSGSSHKPSSIYRWLENEPFLAALWDGKESFESKFLSWEFYLDLLLAQGSPIRGFFDQIDDIKSAIQVQEDFDTLLYFSPSLTPKALLDVLFPSSPNSEVLLANPQTAPSLCRLERCLAPIPSNADKLLAIDLCRLAICSPRFSDALIQAMGSLKLSAYWNLSRSFKRLAADVRSETRREFRNREFRAWREEHQKEFLADKRKWEKEKKTYARPYIDYLDRKEEELFALFWKEQQLPLLLEKIHSSPDQSPLQKIATPLSSELAMEFFKTFRSFQELDRPLLGHYATLQKEKQTEKDLAAAFYPVGGFGFSRSYAFQSSAPQGSLFKLITAYEGLRQGHPPILIDEIGPGAHQNQIVAYALNRTPYPRIYKGGRLPRSSSSKIGQIDLIGAIEQSSNPYFSILAGDYLKSPEDLKEAAHLFGYGEKSGIALPGEIGGHLPTDLAANRTGLYSFAIGQHTLLATPLQAATMLAAIANGGHLLQPQIVKADVPKERRPLFLPPSLRNLLLEGMDRSIWGAKGGARPSAIKTLLSNPLLMRNYLSLQHQMIGKTSTAEILFKPTIDPSLSPHIHKHVWFGAIAFDANPLLPAKMRWEHPELVVVVFLRFGDAGKEAAPIAAQMIHKWREIRQKWDKSSS